MLACTGDLGNSVIRGPHEDMLAASRPEPPLVRSDCVRSDEGETHLMGIRDLKDPYPDLCR